jgi:DNA-binding NtrC family response regulator
MPLHIILVDDDEAIRLLFARMLRRKFPMVEITELDNGLDALVTLKQQSTDLLITNHSMPGMTGLMLVCEVRAQGYTLPILMVSGTADLEVQAQQAGVTCFLSKNRALDTLGDVVADMLEPCAE